jgi:hypothetical protein
VGDDVHRGGTRAELELVNDTGHGAGRARVVAPSGRIRQC